MSFPKGIDLLQPQAESTLDSDQQTSNPEESSPTGSFSKVPLEIRFKIYQYLLPSRPTVMRAYRPLATGLTTYSEGKIIQTLEMKNKKHKVQDPDTDDEGEGLEDDLMVITKPAAEEIEYRPVDAGTFGQEGLTFVGSEKWETPSQLVQGLMFKKYTTVDNYLDNKMLICMSRTIFAQEIRPKILAICPRITLEAFDVFYSTATFRYKLDFTCINQKSVGPAQEVVDRMMNIQFDLHTRTFDFWRWDIVKYRERLLIEFNKLAVNTIHRITQNPALPRRTFRLTVYNVQQPSTMIENHFFCITSFHRLTDSVQKRMFIPFKLFLSSDSLKAFHQMTNFETVVVSFRMKKAIEGASLGFRLEVEEADDCAGALAKKLEQVLGPAVVTDFCKEETGPAKGFGLCHGRDVTFHPTVFVRERAEGMGLVHEVPWKERA